VTALHVASAIDEHDVPVDERTGAFVALTVHASPASAFLSCVRAQRADSASGARTVRRPVHRGRHTRRAQPTLIVIDASALTGLLLADKPAVEAVARAVVEHVWDLRHELAAYDATYLALAEALGGATLITADRGLAERARRSLGADRVVGA
jgi:hypothetical protein